MALDADSKNLSNLARGQVMMLSAQFLLGMAITLIGQPSETSGSAKLVSSIFLGLHVLIALGLVVGGAMALRAAWKLGTQFIGTARYGAVAIGLTIIAGILTTVTENNWWSYLMAVGFIASFFAYGKLYMYLAGSARSV